MEKLKCLICGMNISENSYHLNNDSFIEKNEEGRIMNCPFCGVGRIYIDSVQEIYTVDHKSLDTQSLQVLDHAMKLEVFNGEFYEEAGKLSKEKELKKLFKDLSNIEFMHARVHKRLGEFDNLPKLHKPDYAKHHTDNLLLEEAYKRESHAIAFYKKNSDKITCPVIKEVFKALSDVEKQHQFIANAYVLRK
ncbi:ferritin family protein [Marinisporobacter balticus]|uniref:Rubrerythrin n=1 Tax=Marinisporobacter balticus TaxID=2018667 RepID=A0A4R2KYQ1_9FIRM|nr:ferritin family protein [Marinisporobacter balticus]TCO79214.1 rubrerythrin [Marinisporobacter balticus]